MRAPLQNTQGAIPDDQDPMELAMMDLLALPLSIAQSREDRAYTFHLHHLQAISHQVSD
jgi:hypothetical protein